MDIKNIVTIFYTLEEMQATVLADSPSSSMLPSHELFAEDLHNFQQKFNENFAAMLYDYMTYSIMKELIDGTQHCDDCFSSMLGCNSRFVFIEDLEREYYRIDPEDLYSRANELFYDSYWHGPFGGPSWGKAVDIANQYGKIPDIMFIDSLIDLQHNTDIS